MEEVYQFLKENSTFYLATVENDQPRVRPFGAVAAFEGKLYICTNSTKDVYKQMMVNSKVEICGMDTKGGWLRVEAKAIRDDRAQARFAVLDENPSLKGMYKADDGIFEVLYLQDAVANFCTFGSEPRTVKF